MQGLPFGRGPLVLLLPITSDCCKGYMPKTSVMFLLRGTGNLFVFFYIYPIVPEAPDFLQSSRLVYSDNKCNNAVAIKIANIRSILLPIFQIRVNNSVGESPWVSRMFRLDLSSNTENQKEGKQIIGYSRWYSTEKG